MKHSRSIFIFSALIIAMFCILGAFSRPYPSDEFDFYNLVAEKGYINALIHHFNNMNGRVSNAIIVDFFSGFKLEKIYPFIASVNSLAYILACFSLAGALFPALSAGVKLSLSFLACALTLCFSWSLFDTFYWLPGSPYFLAQTLILFSLSLAIKAFRGSRSSFILCLIILFLNATNLEQPCVFQGITAFLALIFFCVRRDGKRALMSCAFWLVSVAGFCVMYFAPGTAARMSSTELTTLIASKSSILASLIRGLIPAFSLGVFDTFHFFMKPLVYAVIFFMPAIAAKLPPADKNLSLRLRVWHIVLAVFAVGMFMQFMMGVISGRGFPPRAVSLSLWLMYFVWNAMFIFFYRGKLTHSEGFRNFCAKFRWPVLIISVLVSANFIECAKDLRIAPEYAAEHDARVQYMLEQRDKGEKNIQVHRLRTKPELIASDYGLGSLYPNTAKYYGLGNVYVAPYELADNPEAVKKLMSGDFSPLEELAEQGNLYMIRRMGSYRDPKLNIYGEDASKAWNTADAEKWFKMGAEMGETECMWHYARIIRPRNFPAAVCWLVKRCLYMIRL